MKQRAAGRPEMMRAKVECHAGHRAEEEPRRLVLDDRRVEVVAILDRWLAPDHRYFKVRGDDGAEYRLRHLTDSDTWEVRPARSR